MLKYLIVGSFRKLQIRIRLREFDSGSASELIFPDPDGHKVSFFLPDLFFINKKKVSAVLKQSDYIQLTRHYNG